MNEEKWNCVLVHGSVGRVTIEHWTLIALPRKSHAYTEFTLEDRRMCVLTAGIRTMELRPIQ